MVFVSYSRADSEFALNLATDLKNVGLDIWLDQLDIPVGAIWDNEIEMALQKCESVILILSEHSTRSNNVLNEVYYALEENKKVLPVKIDGCKIPFRLTRLHFVDLSVNYEKGLKDLLRVFSLSHDSRDNLPQNANPVSSQPEAAKASVSINDVEIPVVNIPTHDTDSPVSGTDPTLNNYKIEVSPLPISEEIFENSILENARVAESPIADAGAKEAQLEHPAKKTDLDVRLPDPDVTIKASLDRDVKDETSGKNGAGALLDQIQNVHQGIPDAEFVGTINTNKEQSVEEANRLTTKKTSDDTKKPEPEIRATRDVGKGRSNLGRKIVVGTLLFVLLFVIVVVIANVVSRENDSYYETATTSTILDAPAGAVQPENTAMDNNATTTTTTDSKQDQYYSFDHSDIIRSFVSAEDNGNLDEIFSFFSPNLYRYWSIYNPSYAQLANEYGRALSIPDRRNSIGNIERISDREYILHTTFSYYSEIENQRVSKNSRVKFVFDDNGKILETYGL